MHRYIIVKCMSIAYSYLITPSTLPKHQQHTLSFPSTTPHHRAGPPPTGSTVTAASPFPVAP